VGGGGARGPTNSVGFSPPHSFFHARKIQKKHPNIMGEKTNPPPPKKKRREKRDSSNRGNHYYKYSSSLHSFPPPFLLLFLNLRTQAPFSFLVCVYFPSCFHPFSFSSSHKIVLFFFSLSD